jgi:hypothetical protein
LCFAPGPEAGWPDLYDRLQLPRSTSSDRSRWRASGPAFDREIGPRSPCARDRWRRQATLQLQPTVERPLHMLVLQGVYVEDEGNARFVRVGGPSTADVAMRTESTKVPFRLARSRTHHRSSRHCRAAGSPDTSCPSRRRPQARPRPTRRRAGRMRRTSSRWSTPMATTRSAHRAAKASSPLGVRHRPDLRTAGTLRVSGA